MLKYVGREYWLHEKIALHLGADRVHDAVETGKLDLDDIVIRIRELRSRQDQLQARRIELENNMSDRKVELVDIETITSYVGDLHELLKEGSL